LQTHFWPMWLSSWPVSEPCFLAFDGKATDTDTPEMMPLSESEGQVAAHWPLIMARHIFQG